MGFFDKQATAPIETTPFRFTAEGDAIVGTVVRIGKPFQGKNMKGEPAVTTKGNPIYTLPVDMETEEGGKTLFVEGWAMTQAIGDALRAVGLEDLEEGVQLGLKRGPKEKNPAGFMAWTYTAMVKTG